MTRPHHEQLNSPRRNRKPTYPNFWEVGFLLSKLNLIDNLEMQKATGSDLSDSYLLRPAKTNLLSKIVSLRLTMSD